MGSEMKTPIDKINSGANDIVQIVCTTACNLFWCSNCTQILPFRKDIKHMSPEVFRQTLRSLDGWPGVRAMFGGNPCVHPQFPELCRIMAEEVSNQNQRGLWTNDLMKHGEITKRTFWPYGRFNLNVHCDVKAADYMREWLPGIPILGEDRPSWHSPILMDYRDFGISDENWIEMRENCDINQRWSAAIMERDGAPYAYFCEVAGALDGIREENNGILAEPGWWKWPMNRFENQVKSCCDRGCGVPLKRKGHLDSDETYDISSSWQEATQLRNAFTLVHVGLPEGTEIPTDYQARWSEK